MVVRCYFGGYDPHEIPEGKNEICSYRILQNSISSNQEINGLTFAGVGDQTEIDYVQVSYNGDDSYEFFGGTVNVKHLIAFRGWDDEFDTDNGWSGMAQFCLGLRDHNIADQSGSNGFESDNDAQGTLAEPFTKGIFAM
jgi:hypothetical protein